MNVVPDYIPLHEFHRVIPWKTITVWITEIASNNFRLLPLYAYQWLVFHYVKVRRRTDYRAIIYVSTYRTTECSLLIRRVSGRTKSSRRNYHYGRCRLDNFKKVSNYFVLLQHTENTLTPTIRFTRTTSLTTPRCRRMPRRLFASRMAKKLLNFLRA